MSETSVKNELRCCCSDLSRGNYLYLQSLRERNLFKFDKKGRKIMPKVTISNFIKKIPYLQCVYCYQISSILVYLFPSLSVFSQFSLKLSLWYPFFSEQIKFKHYS